MTQITADEDESFSDLRSSASSVAKKRMRFRIPPWHSWRLGAGTSFDVQDKFLAAHNYVCRNPELPHLPNHHHRFLPAPGFAAEGAENCPEDIFNDINSIANRAST